MGATACQRARRTVECLDHGVAVERLGVDAGTVRPTGCLGHAWSRLVVSVSRTRTSAAGVTPLLLATAPHSARGVLAFAPVPGTCSLVSASEPVRAARRRTRSLLGDAFLLSHESSPSPPRPALRLGPGVQPDASPPRSARRFQRSGGRPVGAAGSRDLHPERSGAAPARGPQASRRLGPAFQGTLPDRPAGDVFARGFR